MHVAFLISFGIERSGIALPSCPEEDQRSQALFRFTPEVDYLEVGAWVKKDQRIFLFVVSRQRTKPFRVLSLVA